MKLYWVEGDKKKVTIVFRLGLYVVLILYNDNISVQYVYTNSGKHPNKIRADNTLAEVTIGIPPRIARTSSVSVKF